MVRIDVGKKGYGSFLQALMIKVLSSLTATFVIWLIRSLINIL